MIANGDNNDISVNIFFVPLLPKPLILAKKSQKCNLLVIILSYSHCYNVSIGTSTESGSW